MTMLRVLTSRTMVRNTVYSYPHPRPLMEIETKSATNIIVKAATVSPALHEVLNNKNLFPRGESA